MYKKHFPHKRYRNTLEFMQEVVAPPSSILDLGIRNPFCAKLEQAGYQVQNTLGEDLDRDQSAVQNSTVDVVTAFEIFEHLLCPLQTLQAIKANKLVTTVPLRLWFSPAYQSKTDPWDRHYHEFEAWQFDWLLEKSGWTICARRQWTNPVARLGIRPLLRYFTPRYYAIYAERKAERKTESHH